MRKILTVLILVAFYSTYARAICEVDVQNTSKWSDEVSLECGYHSPTNAYYIDKNVEWSIKFVDVGIEHLLVNGSGQCSGPNWLFPTKCWPQFPNGYTKNLGKTWAQDRANQTYSGGSCHQGPWITFERRSSDTACQPNSEEECASLGWYWNFSNSTCNEDPQSIYECSPPCTGEYFCFQGICSDNTPIIIDVLGDGFDLTNSSNGVDFDFNGNGIANRLSWTKPNSDDAFLVLDRNLNGKIDNGKELFGNFTPQSVPLGVQRNGFLALAELDKAINGGNEDGLISKDDPDFGRLRLWQDANHNGNSESSELHRLKDLGLKKLHLDYEESEKTDRHGNQFRYRAKVKDNQDAQMGRWAWDIILVNAP